LAKTFWQKLFWGTAQRFFGQIYWIRLFKFKQIGLEGGFILKLGTAGSGSSKGQILAVCWNWANFFLSTIPA
jgi:hypothetical protein